MPSAIRLGMPPTHEATVGTPASIASTSAFGLLSMWLGYANTSAASSSPAMAAASRRPSHSTRYWFGARSTHEIAKPSRRDSL